MLRVVFFLALFFCLAASVLSEGYGYQQFYEPQYNAAGFDQSLSYAGSGSGSVPVVPTAPTYEPPSTGTGSGSVPSGGYDGGSTPSYGGGSDGSAPSYGGGSGSGSVPSVDPGTGSVPTVPSSGGIPTVPSSGGIPTVPSSGGIPTTPSTGGVPTTGGCSCDFWAAHINSWPDPMQFISTVSAIFGGLAGSTFGPGTTLLTALRQQRNDPYSQLLRQGTAAMLNACARPHFQYTPNAVRGHFNAALVSPHAAAVQAAKFANANRGYGTATLCS